MIMNKMEIKVVFISIIFMTINTMKIKTNIGNENKQIIVSPKKQILNNIEELDLKIKQIENKLSKENKTNKEKKNAIEKIRALSKQKLAMQNVIKYPDIISIIAIAGHAISTVIMTAWQFKVDPVKALRIAFAYTEQQAKEIFYDNIKSLQKKLNENMNIYPDKLNELRTAKNAREINKAGEKLMQNVKSNIAFDVFANINLNKQIGN